MVLCLSLFIAQFCPIQSFCVCVIKNFWPRLIFMQFKILCVCVYLLLLLLILVYAFDTVCHSKPKWQLCVQYKISGANEWAQTNQNEREWKKCGEGQREREEKKRSGGDKEALTTSMDETMNKMKQESERKGGKKERERDGASNNNKNNDKILWINNNEPTIYKQCFNFRSDFIDRVAILFIYFVLPLPLAPLMMLLLLALLFLSSLYIGFGYLKHIGPKRFPRAKNPSMQVSWSFYRFSA